SDAHETEVVAREPSRGPAPHHVRVAAERLEPYAFGQASRGPQRLEQRLPSLWQVHPRPGNDPDPDVDHVLLGKVPAVALEIRLHVELRRRVADGVGTVGRQSRLALLGDHDLFLPGYLSKGLRHGAVVPPRADDDWGREDPTLTHDPDPISLAGEGGDSRALARVGAGVAGPVQKMVVELAPDDAVAGGPSPARLVVRAVEREPTGGKRLDGERILLGVDLDVGQRLRRHPARADLDARKDRGVEQERPEARPREPPRRRTAPRSSADDDDVVGRHVSSARGRHRAAVVPEAATGSPPSR